LRLSAGTLSQCSGAVKLRSSDGGRVDRCRASSEALCIRKGSSQSHRNAAVVRLRLRSDSSPLSAAECGAFSVAACFCSSRMMSEQHKASCLGCETSRRRTAAVEGSVACARERVGARARRRARAPPYTSSMQIVWATLSKLPCCSHMSFARAPVQGQQRLPLCARERPSILAPAPTLLARFQL